ncbi:neuropeptide Y receptor type 5-like [Panonychus citri]|uniref:neuropeptide Y receptor type 5-like n=1 Tax=Panonychus citri TaxID=50023 RepID=UPI002306F952|nr:neuropeptide Y receptor type 5-like [Panonychus citri]
MNLSESVGFFELDSHSQNNLTLENYFELALSEPLQIFLICLYSLTALLAFGGNITAIWVLMAGKRSSKELRIFLVNLAASDITMALFSIPFTYTSYMLNRWIFHPLFCPFVQFMTLCSVIVSVYTLTAIGIDRYCAIMNPFSSTNWTKARGKLTVGLIWFLALSLSSVQIIHSKAVPEYFGNETFYICREIWPSPLAERTYTVAIFLITFILPMIILVYTYTCIAWKMLNHISPGNANAARDEAQLEAKMKVIKMLAVVVILFAVCWLPLHIFNILYWFEVPIFDPGSDTGFYLHNGLFFLCHWLAMANSFLNPIIYCFMSDNFRNDLEVLVQSCYCFNSKRLQSCRSHGFRPISGENSIGSSFKTTTIVLRTTSIKVNNSTNVQSSSKEIVTNSNERKTDQVEMDIEQD